MQKMSVWGVGPLFTVLSVAYSIVMLVITYSFYPLFRIDCIPYPVLAASGIVLTGVGIVFLVVSVKALTRAYKANQLITDGIYRCCRHPLYASWTVFIVPGIILVSNSSIGLTVPFFMYLMLRILVRKEEDYLEVVFGRAYTEYKRKTPMVIPYGCLKRR